MAGLEPREGQQPALWKGFAARRATDSSPAPSPRAPFQFLKSVNFGMKNGFLTREEMGEPCCEACPGRSAANVQHLQHGTPPLQRNGRATG